MKKLFIIDQESKAEIAQESISKMDQELESVMTHLIDPELESVSDKDPKSKSIAIIGGGWYGVHLALYLRRLGHSVTLFEQNPAIMSENSGKFAIRLHGGEHYPRSPETRKACSRGLKEFRKVYPNLVVEHEYSIYALGDKDSASRLPKVSKEEFEAVGKEREGYKEITPEKAGYTNLTYAMSVDEPSILVGKALREKFMGYLTKAGVKIVCDFQVAKCEKEQDGRMAVIGKDRAEHLFEQVINTTSYQSLVTKNDFPLHEEVKYQPCVVLTYEDTEPQKAPFSFTIMDGLFPCVMPYIDEDPENVTKYVLYHAEWTPLRSCDTQEEAHKILSEIDDDFVQNTMKGKFEQQINRFWPEFKTRFKHDGFVGSVIAKVKNNREYRCAMTYEDSDGMINVFPGKVNNIFDVARETRRLMNNENIKVYGNYRCVEGGALDSAMHELREALDPRIVNSCELQSYNELKEKKLVKKDEWIKHSENTFSFKDSRIRTSFSSAIPKEQSNTHAPSTSPTRV